MSPRSKTATDLVFADGADAPAPAERSGWKILVVDDDADVHDATDLALQDVDVLGRPLALLHARSAAQAKQVLQSTNDVAVVLLDVVMEAPDSGLQLVGFIRQTLGLTDTRIILRTGQPGYAPELSAIREYDINDYKTKSELTRSRLVTTLIAAIRSYEQIRRIEAGRRGLDAIVSGTPLILASRGLPQLAATAIAQLAGLLETAGDGLVALWRPTAVNGPSITVLAGSGRHAALAGQALDAVPAARWRDELRAALHERRSRVGEHCVVAYFGEHEGLRLAALVAPAADRPPADPNLIEVFCNNVSVCLDNVRLLEQLREFAYVDRLVELPNRLGLIEELQRRARAEGRSHLTLALVDIDRFSEINNALGHAFGDQVLRAVARQLRQALDPSCCVARIGTDVFAVLGTHERVNPRRLREALGGGVPIGGQTQPLTVTLGLLRLADGAGDAADLLKDASVALKHAKQVRRGHEWYYTPEMGIEIRERLRLLDALREAIERERLYLVYQPQIDLATGRAVGAEALLRWRTDEGEQIAPDRFVPLAEHAGLIVGIGQWVLRSACRFQRRLHEAGFPGFRMAVNLSVAQFRDLRLAERVAAALAESAMDPACLELEITESVAMDGEGEMFETLAMLRTLGIQIAIDDFGTGYSSLGYLKRMQVDRLKIDRSFTHELGNGATGSIAETVVQLGRALDLAVTAEGVEDERQAQALRRLGCPEAQGYHFAVPMPHDEFVAWLQARGTAARA